MRCGWLGFRAILLSHTYAGAQGVADLLERYRLSEDEAGAQPKGIRNASFALDDRNGYGSFVQRGGSRTVKDLSGRLWVVAVDDQQVEPLGTQPLERERRIARVLEADLELIEDLGNGMNCLFITAEQENTRGHGDLMLRRPVTLGQVTVVSRTGQQRPFGCEAESGFDCQVAPPAMG